MCISKARLKDELEPMVKGEANYQFPQLLGGPYSPTTPEIRRKEKNDNVAYNQMCWYLKKNKNWDSSSMINKQSKAYRISFPFVYPILFTWIAWTERSKPLSRSYESGIGASWMSSLKAEESAVASWESPKITNHNNLPCKIINFQTLH